MLLFIKRISFFLLLWILITGIVDICITKMIRQSVVREFIIWDDIFNSRITANMIVLGSSKAYAHYNPIVFDSVLHTDFYNLGLNGKRIDMDIFRYHQYKKYKNHQPEYIIWDIMQQSFDCSGGYGDEQFMPYIYDEDVWNAIHNPSHNITIIERYLPLLRYWKRDMIKSYPQSGSLTHKGYIKEYTKFDSKDLRKINNHSIHCSYNHSIINDFIKTIREMKSDGSKVIIVFSPFYYLGQEKIIDNDKLIDTVSWIAQNEHCYLLNYMNHPINNDSTLFKNAYHLNCYGADVFSEILAHDLDSIFNIDL